MKKTCYFLLIALLITSCNTGNKKGRVMINGTIGHFIGGTVVLKEIEPEGLRTIDSVRIGNTGDFSFRIDPESTGFYVLIPDDKQKLVLCVEPGENISVRGDREKPVSAFTVTGSPGTLSLQEFYSQTAGNQEIADSLESKLKEMMGSEEYYKASVSFDTIFRAILDAQREFEKDYIQKHPSSLSSLLVLYFTFGPEPILSYDPDSSVFLQLDSSLSVKYPGNKHVIAHHQRIDEYRREAAIKSRLKKEKEEK